MPVPPTTQRAEGVVAATDQLLSEWRDIQHDIRSLVGLLAKLDCLALSLLANISLAVHDPIAGASSRSPRMTYRHALSATVASPSTQKH
jgi:hypothetical protein